MHVFVIHYSYSLFEHDAHSKSYRSVIFHYYKQSKYRDDGHSVGRVLLAMHLSGGRGYKAGVLAHAV